jgi:hypothetical protein
MVSSKVAASGRAGVLHRPTKRCNNTIPTARRKSMNELTETPISKIHGPNDPINA